MNERHKPATIFDDLDVAEGHQRYRSALARLDTRTGEVLASHVALEAELDITFEELFPHPAFISNFGLGNKVRVLKAVYRHALVDMIGDALIEFDALRNSVAHRQRRADINAKFGRVCAALNIDKDTATVQGIAQALMTGIAMARRDLVPTWP